MVKKQNQSVERVFKEFQNVDIATISLVQQLFQNKQYEQVFNVLQKDFQPYLKRYKTTQEAIQKRDEYGKALGRLANQYIALMNNPTQQQVKFIDKKYNVQLVKDYLKNLEIAGNYKPISSKKPSISVNDIISAHGILGINSSGHLQTTIKIPDLIVFENDIQIIDFYRSLIKSQKGIRFYRIYAYIKCKSGNYIWISTSWELLGNYKIIEDLLDNTEVMINEGYNYYNEGSENYEVLYNIEELIIEYY